MKHHRRPRAAHRLTVPLVLFIAFVVIFAVIALNRGHVSAPAEPASAKAVTVQSQFAFTGTPSWRKGPSNKTSLALFHDGDGCFTSVEHKSGTVDVTAAIQKNQASLVSGGNTMTPGAVLTVSMQMKSGTQSYELHQFKLSSPSGADKLMEGLELGYLQLKGSYIEIQGHCDTTTQLPATIPALQAITFSD